MSITEVIRILHNKYFLDPPRLSKSAKGVGGSIQLRSDYVPETQNVESNCKVKLKQKKKKEAEIQPTQKNLWEVIKWM